MNRKHADIANAGDVSRPALLSEGIVTPTIFSQLLRHNEAYFAVNNVPNADKVKRTAYSLQPVKIAQWYESRRAELNTSTWEAFVPLLRAIALEPGWASKERLAMEDMKQGGALANDFWFQIITRNQNLAGTGQEMDELSLKYFFHAHLDTPLKKAVSEDPFILQTEILAEFIVAVCELDERIRAEDERMDARIKKMQNNLALRTYPVRATQSTPTPTTTIKTQVVQRATSAPAKATYLPRMTPKERDILTAFGGCFRCRHYEAGHRSSSCEVPFNLFNRLEITESAGNAARAAVGKPKLHLSKKSTVAAVAEEPAHDHHQLPPHARAYFAQLANATAPSSSSSTADNVVAAACEVEMPPIANGGIYEYNSESENESCVAPLRVPPISWDCLLGGPASSSPVQTCGLIDSGSSLVIIDQSIVDRLGLSRRRLKTPLSIRLAITGGNEEVKELVEFVTLDALSSTCNRWKSKSIRAFVSPNLVVPLLLGNPFLSANNLLIDTTDRKIICKKSGINICDQRQLRKLDGSTPKERRRKLVADMRNQAENRKVVHADLLESGRTRKKQLDELHSSSVDPIFALQERIVSLSEEEDLKRRDAAMKEKYHVLFPADIPPVADLPNDVFHRFRLIDANKVIRTRSYSSPRRYKEAWSTLLEQHLDAGRIRPSSSSSASAAFLLDKADKAVLPRMVIDFRGLNANTVPDCFPLPRVDDILAACAKGKIWGKIDMTNAFFQTKIHPDDIPLTAFTTPHGLYEWTVMPMGCRNAPSTHQRRMTQALRGLIGKICYVYLDDIIIWSQNVDEHTRNVETVLNALKAASLYCSIKKTTLFCNKLSFLGHEISREGIKPDPSKTQRIQDWPTPRSASDVRGFLGLVRYLGPFLCNLADHTRVLNELTTKDAEKHFAWTIAHENAFQRTKSLVLSAECLTAIDHDEPAGRKIFLHTDASDFRTGAVLSFGTDPTSARPVAYDSTVLKGAERNYPVHEKELLAIVRALKKFRADLLGGPFIILTDHRTLEHFIQQPNLSRRQARWQEFLADYDFVIQYVKGSDNSVADALSRLPDHTPESVTCASVLDISADASLVNKIKAGYDKDAFCASQLRRPLPSLGFRLQDGLLFLHDRLVIPRTDNLREELYRLAHDSMGHYGVLKTYKNLQTSFYWPNMRTDLEHSYIKGCFECQRNKSATRKPVGPLHPLPIADQRGDTIFIDFVGPLMPDSSFNYLCTITDQLASDIRLIPCRTDITAPQFASLFFDSWYCENGLPLRIVSDRDHLFISSFWKTLHKLSGINLKLSSSFHPQTDGLSERTNKTVIQALRFYVDRHQTGWVSALPRVRFELMNTINESTGFSPFQMRLGRSPRLLPPLVASNPNPPQVEQLARQILQQLELDCEEAKDALVLAKTRQAAQHDKHRSDEDVFKVGDKVLLNTLHRRRDYMQSGDGRVAKFMPRWDGPYSVIKSFPESSSYHLDIPGYRNRSPAFHASQIKRFFPNDDNVFPGRARTLAPTITNEFGEEESFVDKIIDQRRRGRGIQYLVRWLNEGPEGDKWLARSELIDCQALDEWERKLGSNSSERGGV